MRKRPDRWGTRPMAEFVTDMETVSYSLLKLSSRPRTGTKPVSTGMNDQAKKISVKEMRTSWWYLVILKVSESGTYMSMAEFVTAHKRIQWHVVYTLGRIARAVHSSAPYHENSKERDGYYDVTWTGM